MSTMLGSGTFTEIIDESFTSFTVVSATFLIFMRTKKGADLEDITIDNFEDKVGYDIDFNNSYVGLNTLLPVGFNCSSG